MGRRARSMMLNPDSRIYVAGHRGLVGSAICRRLRDAGYRTLLLRTSEELDLRDSAKVHEFFDVEKPEYVFLAAARVGGILANSTRPADFIYDNLAIEMNVIHAAQVAPESASSNSWDPRASIPNSRRNPFAKNLCSPVRWSRPTNGTRSPRSRASRWRRRIEDNTAFRPSH